MLYEHEGPIPEPDLELYGDTDIEHAVEELSPNTGTTQPLITIDNPAFSDLRRAVISALTAHSYIKGYNKFIGATTLLDIQIPAVLDKQLMSCIQVLHLDSSITVGLNNVCNGIYFLLLIHPHLNNQIA